jgi:hypothetical protein
MSQEAVVPRGEDLEASVGILKGDRVARDRRSEVLPRRPRACGRDLRGPAERTFGSSGKDGETFYRH